MDAETMASESPTKPTTTATVAGEVSSIPIITTQPESIVRHNISDEELSMLINSNKDGFTDIMWGFIGAFLSSFPSAVSYIISYYEEKDKLLPVLNLIQILICAVSLTAALIFYKIHRKKSKMAADLSTEIRRRAVGK